jgi:hypothetical protein
MSNITPNICRNSLLAQKILSVSTSESNLEDIIIKIVMLIQKEICFDAVGIRLNDNLDYPYFFTNGFDPDFVNKEMFLCAKDATGEIVRDSNGDPVLECMCGNIIYGRTNPELPFFSKNGSFWSNCTSELLASTSENDRMTHTRNRCNSVGYESVALIPIKSENKIHGLIQLNDHRKNMFTLEDVLFYESIGTSVGIVFLAFKAKQQLAVKSNDLLRLAQVQLKVLQKISEQLDDRMKINDNDISGPCKKLESLIDEISSLKGIIPICASCKKVRTDFKNWQQIEGFISDRTCAHFSHTYCPECYQKWIIN